MINTKGLLIIPWTSDMASEFYELSMDEGFILYPITNYRQQNVEDAEKWILSQSGKYAVIEKESGIFIGMGRLTPWVWEQENLVDITYRLKKSAQGKGYGLELAQALKNHAFNVLKLKQISATIVPENLPSKIIAEKIGMKFEKRIVIKGVDTDLYNLHNN